MATIDDILNASDSDDDLVDHLDLDLEALLDNDDSDDEAIHSIPSISPAMPRPNSNQNFDISERIAAINNDPPIQINNRIEDEESPQLEISLGAISSVDELIRMDDEEEERNNSVLGTSVLGTAERASNSEPSSTLNISSYKSSRREQFSLEATEKSEVSYLHSGQRIDSSALQGPLLSQKSSGRGGQADIPSGESPEEESSIGGSLKCMTLDSLTTQLQRNSM